MSQSPYQPPQTHESPHNSLPTSDPRTSVLGSDSTSGGSVSGGSLSGGSTSEAARDEATQTKDAAVGAAQDVAATAKQEAAGVAAEVQDRAADLVGQVAGELQSQGRTQQQRLAGGLSSAGHELDQMASGSNGDGVATQVTRQVSQQLSRAGEWLDGREPSDVLDEVRGFARRQPVAFLIGAGLAGFVVGRLARSVVANRTELDSPPSSSGSTRPRPPVLHQPAIAPVEPTPVPASLQEDTATPGAASVAMPVADQTLPGDPDLPGSPVRGDVAR